MSRKILPRFIFASAFSIVCTSVSTFASSIVVKHDPTKCPTGMEGRYRVSPSSDMNVFVTRDTSHNLVIQFKIDGGLAGEPTIVDGKWRTVNSVTNAGESYEAGKIIYFCQQSSVYSKFISNDESNMQSNIGKMSVAPGGIKVQQIAPPSSVVKLWPRVN